MLPEKYAKPQIVVITLTDNCALTCSFCNNNKKFKNVMPFESFKMIIEKFISEGIYSFELTPTVGDSITISNLYQYFDYLEQHPKVNTYFWFTSLVSSHKLSDEEIDRLFLNRKKFYTVVSIYSLHYNNYKVRTQSSKATFNIFDHNLTKLLELNLPKDQLILRNRSEGNRLDEILFVNKMKEYPEPLWETCSKDSLNYNGSREQLCCNFYINFGCFLNGDITTCAYADFRKEAIIGNVFNFSLKEILYNYYNKHRDADICKNCMLYDPIEGSNKTPIDEFNESFGFKTFRNREQNFRIGGINEISEK